MDSLRCNFYSVDLPDLGYEMFCSKFKVEGSDQSKKQNSFAQHLVEDDFLYFYSYAIGPAPNKLVPISTLRDSKIFPAAIRIEGDLDRPPFYVIEIKKKSPKYKEIVFVLDEKKCVGSLTEIDGVTLQRKSGAIGSIYESRQLVREVYKFSDRDQIVISEWIASNYNRHKIDEVFRANAMIRNYGIHIFIQLNGPDDASLTASILPDKLAVAVIYRKSDSES